MSRLIVTLVAVVIVVGAVLGAAGVLHFRNTDDQSSVTLDKKELNAKTQDVIKKTEETGSKILDKTGAALHKAADTVRKEPSATPAAPNNENRRQPDDAAR